MIKTIIYLALMMQVKTILISKNNEMCTFRVVFIKQAYSSRA